MEGHKLFGCPFCGRKARISVLRSKHFGYNGYGDEKVRVAARAIRNVCKARGPIVTETIINPRRREGAAHVEELEMKAAELWNERK